MTEHPDPLALVIVPFVSRATPALQADWLDALSAACPQVRIVPLAECDALTRTQASVAVVADPDPRELAGLPNLRWVQSLWAGVERLLAELPADGPRIVRLVDPQLARTMAEAVLAWTLYLHRDMPAYLAAQRERVWRPLPVVRAAARPVGVLGLGQLGAAAAQVLRTHGFPVLGWARHRRPVSGVEVLTGTAGLDALLRRVDIVVNLLPLTDQTRGLLDASRLAACRPGACLINFGRAAVIDEAALRDALDAGQVAHAVLDVFAVEPLPADSPWWGHPRVTLLPHVSAPTDKDSAARIVAANLRDYFRSGVLPAGVDRARGY